MIVIDGYFCLNFVQSGICPLRIETGRYEVVSTIFGMRYKKGLLAEERKCLCCILDKFEDGYFFLLQCPFFNLNVGKVC